MVLPACERLKRLFCFRLAMVVALSLALLALPCSPLAEALGSNPGHALAPATIVHLGHRDADWGHHAKEHENRCCTNCSIWLTTLVEDDAIAVIDAGNSSRSELSPVRLTPAPLISNWPVQARRFTGPQQVAFVDGTSIYAKSQRYRI